MRRKAVKKDSSFTEDMEWEVTISKDKFNKLRQNEEFALVLNLARIMNALKFCYQTSIDANLEISPARQRHRVYSFFFSASILYEGLTFAKKLEDYFSDLDSYKNGFEKLFADPLVEQVREKGSNLDKIRNRITYHFNLEALKEGLQILDLDTYTLGIGKGKQTGHLYYRLGEEAVISFILGTKKSQEEEMSALEKSLKEITGIMVKYFAAAELLIHEVVIAKGWKTTIKE